jgi:hypothetical protein
MRMQPLQVIRVHGLGQEGMRDFEMKYYLVDDSVVVQETGPRRDLDTSGPLIKRLQLPKRFDWAKQVRPTALQL